VLSFVSASTSMLFWALYINYQLDAPIIIYS
jgi:hypothetical protein